MSDEAFRRHLSETHCYPNLGTRTIKYLLTEYEMNRRIEEGEPLPPDLAQILSREYETEHILPQNPVEGLDQDEAAAHEEIVHRLGNLTLASKEWNRTMGNRAFHEKRDGRQNGDPDGKKICYRNFDSARATRPGDVGGMERGVHWRARQQDHRLRFGALGNRAGSQRDPQIRVTWKDTDTAAQAGRGTEARHESPCVGIADSRVAADGG